MLDELLILFIQFPHVENRTTHRNYLKGAVVKTEYT